MSVLWSLTYAAVKHPLLQENNLSNCSLYYTG